MALQNIGASNSDDAFYRYKMPRMVTKIEGRGNGIKTNVVNMVEVAKALARPPSYTTKYFGNELGAQSKFDEKTGVSLVNGAHETAKLAGLLEHFIKKYVQCYGCGNPETEIVISKTQMISLKCAACGFVSDVDMRDKLTTFILKNPPESKKSGKDKKAMRRAEKERLKEGEAADEEQKKLKKETTKKKGTSAKELKSAKKKGSGSDEDHSPPVSHVDEVESPEEPDDDDGVQWQTDTSLEASQQRIQEQLSSVTAEMVMLATEEKGKPDAHSKRVEEIKQILKKWKEEEMRAYMSGLTCTAEEAIRAVVCAVLDGVEKGVAREVVKRRGVIMVAARGVESPGCLLDAIGFYFERVNAEAVKEVALVLKAMYDSDMVEEEAVMTWYNNADKNSAVSKNATPFIEWLQNAESESDGE